MLGVFAEFETAIRRERQLEGIAKAKAAGAYKGRPAKISEDDIRKLQAEGLGATEIAKRLKIGRASVYRVLRGRGARDLTRHPRRVCRRAPPDPSPDPELEAHCVPLVGEKH